MSACDAIYRWQLPGLVPLELWDLITVEAEPPEVLHDRSDRPDFTACLLAALERLRRGEARCRWSEGSLEPARDFAHVALVGGRAGGLDFAELERAPFPVRVLEGAHAAAEGAFHVLRRQGEGRLLVLDIGQTAVKAVAGLPISETAASEAAEARRAGTGLWQGSWPRDTALLPLRRPGTVDETVGGERVDIEEQRRKLRAFFGSCLREAFDQTRPERLLLALPCELDAEGHPGSCSYIGLGGDSRLIPDLLESVGKRAGLGPPETRLVNDAELAALAVREGLGGSPRDRQKVLVLTLGFSIGGAVLELEKGPR